MTEQDICIGIDLGTTFSCVAIWIDDHVEIIPNDLGNRTTPSWVAYNNNNERLVGEIAKQQASMNIKNTIFDIKRILGKKYADSNLQEDIPYFPFNGQIHNGIWSVCIDQDNRSFFFDLVDSFSLYLMSSLIQARFSSS